MTPTAALNHKAKAILIRELGPVDYARFIQQYEEGSGDYIRDRHRWLGGENARTIHEQAVQLAATGAIPRPAGAKFLGPNELKSAPIKSEECENAKPQSLRPFAAFAPLR